jgi:hypothetical protein
MSPDRCRGHSEGEVERCKPKPWSRSCRAARAGRTRPEFCYLGSDFFNTHAGLRQRPRVAVFLVYPQGVLSGGVGTHLLYRSLDFSGHFVK